MGRRLASGGQTPGPGIQDTTSETSPKGVRRSNDDGMNTEEIRRNTGDPSSWGGNDPTQAPRGDEAVRAGVGEVHSSEEAGNDRGAKGPQFRVKAKVVRARNIDENLQHRINLGSRRRFVCRSEGGRAPASHRGQRLDTLSESRDAGNSHVRFDERDLETERHDRHRARYRLYVCREKPRISSGRDNKAHPGTNAPPGTTWRVDGGNKIDQAPQEKGCESSSGSV